MINEANRLEQQVKEHQEKTRGNTDDAKSDKGSEHSTDQDVSFYFLVANQYSISG